MATENTLILYTDLSSLITRLQNVYTTHGLSWDWNVSGGEVGVYPLSTEITTLYNKFVAAQTEEHLATCVKWTITNGELSSGSPLKNETLNAAAASLLSMEAKTHYSRVVNTAGTLYTQTSHSNQTTYSESSNSAGTSYSNTSNGRNCTQNTSRNAQSGNSSRCGCHVVYGSDCSQSTNSATTTYSETSYKAGTTYSQTTNSNETTYTFSE